MRTFTQGFMVTIGAALVAIGYNWFFMPHHLVSTGVAGLAMLLAQVFGWSVGLQVFLYNIPILWWAWRDLGRRFLLLTVVGISALTAIVSLLPARPVITDDPLLNAIFGGLVVGVGVGIAMRAGGSCGGMDVAAVAFNKRFSLPMGDVMLAFNAVVIAAAGLQGDLKVVLYTLVAMFVTGKMVDVVTSGTVKKTVLVISEQSAEVARRINAEMGRGATVVDGVGTYSQASRQVLLCVVTRLELSQVKDIVLAVDPRAFVVVLDTDQVVGRFRPYNMLTRSTKPIA